MGRLRMHVRHNPRLVDVCHVCITVCETCYATGVADPVQERVPPMDILALVRLMFGHAGWNRRYVVLEFLTEWTKIVLMQAPVSA